MPEQCKHCVSRSEFDALDFGDFIGPLITFLGGILSALVLGPIGAIIATIGAWWALQQVCAFLRGGKLICHDKFACVIGRVVEVEPVGHHKSGFEKIDNDYAANLLVAPHLPGATRAAIEADGLQGTFIAPNPISSDIGFAGYTTNKAGFEIPIIHCEFEGNRVCTFCDAAAAAIAMLGAAAALSWLCAIPIIGWIACAIGWPIVLIVAGALLLDGWFGAHDGDPSDAAVNPGDGELAAMDDSGKGGDYVIIRGEWVYDAGHEGWNEFHPVHSVQKLHGAPYWTEGSTAAEVAAFQTHYRDWCHHTALADRPDIQEEQKEPRNRWVLHPDLDGCRDQDDPNEPPVPR
jgi:hypothetical protein